MEAIARRDASRTDPLRDQPGNRIFRQYYNGNDFAVSPEGILKVLSAICHEHAQSVDYIIIGSTWNQFARDGRYNCHIMCIVSSVLYLSSGNCPGEFTLVATATAGALACSALNVLLYAGVVLNLPLYMPQAWLFTDVILSTVMGVLLLIMAVLTMTVCEMNNFISYVHGPLGIVNAAMVTGSAVMTYVSVMRVWDESRMPYEPPQPPLEEVHV